MSTKRNDKIPSNDSILSDSFDGLHMKNPENNISDQELALISTADLEVTWSLRRVAILAPLCLITVLSDGALSMIAPFYPKEVRKYTRKKNDVM